MDALQRGREAGGILEAEAVGADRTRENDMQAVRAVFEIGEGELVGGSGIGMIEAGGHGPVAGGAEARGLPAARA